MMTPKQSLLTEAVSNNWKLHDDLVLRAEDMGDETLIAFQDKNDHIRHLALSDEWLLFEPNRAFLTVLLGTRSRVWKTAHELLDADDRWASLHKFYNLTK